MMVNFARKESSQNTRLEQVEGRVSGYLWVGFYGYDCNDLAIWIDVDLSAFRCVLGQWRTDCLVWGCRFCPSNSQLAWLEARMGWLMNLVASTAMSRLLLCWILTLADLLAQVGVRHGEIPPKKLYSCCWVVRVECGVIRYKFAPSIDRISHAVWL